MNLQYNMEQSSMIVYPNQRLYACQFSWKFPKFTLDCRNSIVVPKFAFPKQLAPSPYDSHTLKIIELIVIVIIITLFSLSPFFIEVVPLPVLLTTNNHLLLTCDLQQRPSPSRSSPPSSPQKLRRLDQHDREKRQPQHTQQHHPRCQELIDVGDRIGNNVCICCVFAFSTVSIPACGVQQEAFMRTAMATVIIFIAFGTVGGHSL